jgi:hypothetical protein
MWRKALAVAATLFVLLTASTVRADELDVSLVPNVPLRLSTPAQVRPLQNTQLRATWEMTTSPQAAAGARGAD